MTNLSGALRGALLVLFVAGCSAGRDDLTPVDAARDTLVLDTARGADVAVEADAASSPSDAPEEAAVDSADAKVEVVPLLDGPICGVPGCMGKIEESATCRTMTEWFAAATKACGTKAIVYFEVGSPCATGGEAGGTSARYSCCTDTPFTSKAAPSSVGCPPHPNAWEVGSGCLGPRAGLNCNYPNACGALENWHCKTGWEPNTTCGCTP